MKQTVNNYEFIDAFEKMGRESNFSYEGLQALFDYLEEYEESCGTEIELDVIALCCEFTEYEDLQEFWNDYDKEEYEDMEDIENTTQVIKIDDESFIIASF